MPHCKSLSDKNSWLYKHQLIFWPFVKHSVEPRRTKTPTFYLKSLQSWWRCTQYRYYSVLIPSMSKGLDKGRHHITDIFVRVEACKRTSKGFLLLYKATMGIWKPVFQTTDVLRTWQNLTHISLTISFKLPCKNCHTVGTVQVRQVLELNLELQSVQISVTDLSVRIVISWW